MISMKSIVNLCLSAVLVLASQSVVALGLGDIQVRSYMGQPFNARIGLIGSTTPEEIATVTVGLAAASDYEFVGMSQSISVPLRFVVDGERGNPEIEVSSRLPIKDPVVQFVVELRWSGGRMLKEYTVFLDPPTVAARAPSAAVYDRRQPEAEAFPDPAQLDVVETVKAESKSGVPGAGADAAENDAEALADAGNEPAPATPEVRTDIRQEPVAVEPAVTVPADAYPVKGPEPAPEEVPEPGLVSGDRSGEVAQSPEQSVQPGGDIPVSTPPGDSGSETEIWVDSATSTMARDDLAAEATRQPAMPLPSARIPAPAVAPSNASGERYGPVRSGDTLWSIAESQARGTPYSINQAMLAIQRLNPDAFGGNNINLLKVGAVLRLPAADEMSRLTQRQAMLEAIRQEEAYALIRAGAPVQDMPPLIADTPAAGAETPAGSSLASTSVTETEETGRLELVPPSQGESAQGGESGTETGTGALSSAELSEMLARTEEELVNAEQENEYLAQRIRELESRMSEQGISVESDDLAEMETRLREDRLAGDDPPIAVSEDRDPEAWYQGKLGWLLAGMLILVAGVFWALRKVAGRNAPVDSGSDGPVSSAVVKMRSEAEEILETLDQKGSAGRDAAGDGQGGQTGVPGGPAMKAPQGHKPRAKPATDSEAVELDVSDPEIRLDLARAYISMGDPEAARQMLEEVLQTGDENQVREAQSMMKEVES